MAWRWEEGVKRLKDDKANGVWMEKDKIDKAWERRGTQQRHSYPENPKCHDADYLFCEDLGIVDNGEGGWRMK